MSKAIAQLWQDPHTTVNTQWGRSPGYALHYAFLVVFLIFVLMLFGLCGTLGYRYGEKVSRRTRLTPGRRRVSTFQQGGRVGGVEVGEWVGTSVGGEDGC